MALNLQTVCNSCGKLLYGKHGKEQVAEPFIYIKGRISLQNLGEYPKKYYQFVTRDDNEETTVCDTECLNDYIELRKKEYKRIREERLRKEAGDNWTALYDIRGNPFNN